MGAAEALGTVDLVRPMKTHGGEPTGSKDSRRMKKSPFRNQANNRTRSPAGHFLPGQPGNPADRPTEVKDQVRRGLGVAGARRHTSAPDPTGDGRWNGASGIRSGPITIWPWGPSSYEKSGRARTTWRGWRTSISSSIPRPRGANLRDLRTGPGPDWAERASRPAPVRRWGCPVTSRAVPRSGLRYSEQTSAASPGCTCGETRTTRSARVEYVD